MRSTLVLVCMLIAASLIPARAVAARLTLDSVAVQLPANGQQVITVRATGRTTARVTFWTSRNGVGRIGYAGLVDPTSRVQGSGTTPTGTYRLPFAFGATPKHRAWRMPYRDFDADDYWGEGNA